jgi:hypothetical protein
MFNNNFVKEDGLPQNLAQVALFEPCFSEIFYYLFPSSVLSKRGVHVLGLTCTRVGAEIGWPWDLPIGLFTGLVNSVVNWLTLWLTTGAF